MERTFQIDYLGTYPVNMSPNQSYFVDSGLESIELSYFYYVVVVSVELAHMTGSPMGDLSSCSVSPWLVRHRSG